MDELSNRTEQQSHEGDSTHADSPFTNGESQNAAARPSVRPITSKRVVIPANAKRLGKIAPVAPPPTAVQPAVQAKEQTETASNGDAAIQEPALLQPISPEIEPSISFAEPVSQELSEPSTSEYAAQPLTEISSPEPEDGQDYELRPNPVIPPFPSSVTEPEQPSAARPVGLPYTPDATSFKPIPIQEQKKRRGLEFLLWGFAGLLLIAAVVAVLMLVFPDLLTGTPPTVVGTPTTVAVTQPTNAPNPTSTQLPTAAAPTDSPLFPTTAPLIIPTPPIDGQQLSLLPNNTLTGWFATGEEKPHYGDENLHAGTFQGKNLASVLQFNLRNLPLDSKILYAAIELTGRDGSRLGNSGGWQLDLVENSLDTDWSIATASDLAAAKSLGMVGQELPAAELAAGRLNRFILSETERQMLEQQFKNGNAVFRLRGPASSQDNLFTWESGASGSPLNAPTLHLVVTPGQYVIVTNTPTPQNVLTAAVYVVRGTDQAKRIGTPTPFPPGVATATPGGGIVVVAAETAIPQNVETAIARTRIAEAVALTTGTFTPAPQTLVIQFPTHTPVVVPPEYLATATPIPPNVDLITIPINYEECQCQGQILLLSTRYGDEKPKPIMLAPDGTEIGKLTGDLFYRLALARESYSPDRTKRLIYPLDSRKIQQVGYLDLATEEIVYLTNFPKGVAYDAVWAPDGSAIAFVATERGNTDEIYIYDFGTERITRITDASQLGQPWSKHPSWSPDSQKIAFWSSRSGTSQIWVMNRDGSNLVNISNNEFQEIDPVWVK